METTFPFSALEGEEDFSPTVEIAVPFRIFDILEMLPHVVMDLLEPLEAFLVAGKLIGLDEADS